MEKALAKNTVEGLEEISYNIINMKENTYDIWFQK